MPVQKNRGRPAQKMVQNKALEQAVVLVGSVKKLALDLGVHPNTVSGWLYRDLKIPAHHIPKIVLATRGAIKAEALRPDVFILLECSEV